MSNESESRMKNSRIRQLLEKLSEFDLPSFPAFQDKVFGEFNQFNRNELQGGGNTYCTHSIAELQGAKFENFSLSNPIKNYA